MKPSGAARDQNPALTLFFHSWQEHLHGLDGAKKVDLQNIPHWV